MRRKRRRVSMREREVWKEVREVAMIQFCLVESIF